MSVVTLVVFTFSSSYDQYIYIYIYIYIYTRAYSHVYQKIYYLHFFSYFNLSYRHAAYSLAQLTVNHICCIADDRRLQSCRVQHK